MSEGADPAKLTSAGLLARNSLWNLLGNTAPLLAAFVSIPILIDRLGTTRFGLLTLAWALVGTLGLFDLGLGRALTKLVAERLGHDGEREVPALIGTGLSLLAVLGVTGAVCMALLIPWLVEQALRTPPELRGEARTAFRWLALSLPFVLWAAGLRGLLAAYQRFDLINAVRIPLGIFTYLAPLAVLPFSRTLPPVVAVLVGGRVAILVAYLALCVRALPGFGEGVAFRREALRPLLGFGGWITVSNIVGPLLVYLDRFLIGAALSVAVIAYYTTPYELVTKLWIVPNAILGVLFPAFATTMPRDRPRAARLFRGGIAAVIVLLGPVLLLVVPFSREGLTLWLGSEFAARSTGILQLLVIGVFLNSLAHIPSSLVQGLGRPDITARLHVVELVLYLPALWVLLTTYGLMGAAIAWVARIALDGAFLLAVTARLVPETRSFLPRFLGVAGCAVALAAAAGRIPGFWSRGMFVPASALAVLLLAWLVLLSREERERIRDLLRRTRTAP